MTVREDVYPPRRGEEEWATNDPMKITRRHLLAMSAASAAAVSVCAGGVGMSWWNQPPGAGFAQLSEAEATFLRAFSGAAFPGGDFIALDGQDAELDVFFDVTLSTMPELTANLLKLLMQGLERWTVISTGHVFSHLPRDAQQAQLAAWLGHDVAEVRSAISSLVVLLGMGYTTHPAVAPVMGQWHRCGYGR